MALKSMTRSDAEILGARTLAWIAGREDLLQSLLAASGASLADLRDGLEDPDFLSFVLEFLLGDEQTVLECVADLSVDPEAPLRAHAALTAIEWN